MRIGSNLCDSTRSFSSISGVEFLASHVFISWWSGIATPSINPTGPPDFMRAMIEYEEEQTFVYHVKCSKPCTYPVGSAKSSRGALPNRVGHNRMQ
jgi:hypothetical protein